MLKIHQNIKKIHVVQNTTLKVYFTILLETYTISSPVATLMCKYGITPAAIQWPLNNDVKIMSSSGQEHDLFLL